MNIKTYFFSSAVNIVANVNREGFNEFKKSVLLV